MKGKKVIALGSAAIMAFSMVGCGSTATTESTTGSSSAAAQTAAESTSAGSTAATATDDGTLSYANVKLGESYTDVTAEIKLLTHRTDMLADDYTGTTWKQYIAEFNKLYPNIKVDVEGITNYADDSLLRLQGGDWGDVMMIPAVDKADLSNYFLSYGDYDTMNGLVNYASQWMYDNQVYGVASTGNAQGIVYNKKVFEQAGITKLPTTPDEFITDLQAIKDKTDAIPLYTNYAAEWTMGAWDAYIAGTATGKTTYMNQDLIHTAAPFKDPGDGTHAYNVYKVLYDAVSKGLTEEDYTTTDWEGCKGMINNGKIGCMVLGSWAVSQMQAAGDNGADIAYMPFPITVDGKQYASSGPDYNYGINASSSPENQEAAMCFVKFMTEKSGFSYNESGLPISKADTKLPDLYSSFSNVTFVADDPAKSGEEDILNELNSDSELMVNAGGNDKIMKIVEHAANGDESFDDIMQEWNDAWSGAQKSDGVTVTE